VQPTLVTFLAVAYVAIFPGLLAYIFFNRGVQLIGSTRAGVFLHLVPLFGTLLAIGLLGEELRLFHLTGFALILLGVWLASRKPGA
jgi:drug/metabolite transporter (DMT)-like permease